MPRALLARADIADRLHRLFADEPDQGLVRARQASERVVAIVRLAIILLIASSNILFSLEGGRVPTVALGMSGASVLYAVALFFVPRWSTGRWVPWAVSTVDVTFATGCLALFVLFGRPLGAINNRVTFETYFVVVTVSVLRFDWRLSAFTSLLAIGEYLGLSAYVASHWDLSTAQSPTHGSFTQAQFFNRLMVLAGHGVAAVAVARWARHLRLMVGTDQLTGLLQRRPFLERIEEELARADLGRTSLSIAIFDVDDFKQFNDRFGHLEGDRVLVRVAEQLKKGVRTTDLVARYGGEEFVIAFPRLDVQLATRRAEALRAAIAEECSSASEPLLTVSAGLASWPTDGQSFEEVLRKADERLYAAKASGRNIVIGPMPSPTPLRAGKQEV